MPDSAASVADFLDEEAIRAVIELAPAGLIVAQGGRIAYANRHALQIVGQWADQLVGRPFDALFDAQQRERLGAAADSVLSGTVDTARGEFRLAAPGNPIELALDLARITLRGAPALLAALRDPGGARPAEAELRTSETNRTLMNALADGVFVAQDRRFVYANPALPAMLGYTDAEFVGLPFEQVVAPELLAAWDERFARRVGDGPEPPRAYETCWVRSPARGAERIELDLVASRVRFRGRPAVLGVVRDITERKRTAAELERHRHRLEELVAERTREMQEAVEGRLRSEHFAQTVTDNQPTLLAYVDTELRLHFANRAYLEWFGRTREEMIGRRIPDVLGGSALQPGADVYERVFGGEAVGMPGDMVAGDGRLGHFWIYRLPDRRGDTIAGYYFIATNVTELKHAEQKLRAMNAALSKAELFSRKVADNIPGRVAYWDRETRCRFVNRVYCEWFGRRRDELIGRTIGEIFGEEGLKRANPRVYEALAGRAQLFERDETSADGQRQTRSLVHYVPDVEDGEVLGFFVLATDIGETRRTSLRLQALNEELVLARNKAEAAAQAKSSFLANMSHEIRTPMNAIIGLTHLLRQDSDDPTVRERADKVGDAAQHLLEIVNDVLDLSKIEAGKLELEHIDFDLDELLSRCCSLVGEAARAKGVEIVVDTDGMPRRLRGDPTRLAQALVNLLGNAVKFTERGNVRLRCELLGTSLHTLQTRFEVRDTGQGIASDRLDQLFNAFEQADAATTRRYGGTGLGLAITRQLAHLMGGRVGVDSELGSGSRFWFTAELEPAERPADDDTLLAGLHVLLVDDLEEARDALGFMLRRMGLRTEIAASGAEAVQRVAAAREAGTGYDVLVVDWRMPGMDGLETVRRIRARLSADGATDDEHPAVILVTAASDPDVRARARQLGITSVLEKPVSASALHEHLLRLLVRAVADSRPGALAPADSGLDDSHRGARVLLAEDHPVNQEVAGALLRMAGLSVDVADNGAIALEMAKRQRYDLILMDMQMPVMDGLDAARAIRAEPALAAVPIIAMTANAFDDDRAACLAAGMDDHVSKPVNPRVLYATLARWLNAERAGLAPVQDDPALAALAGTPGLDAARGQALFAGRADVYRSALETFATLYAGGLELLDRWLAGHERSADAVAALRREVHALGGAAAAIGAQALEAQARSINAALRDAEREVDSDALRRLRDELARLVRDIAARLPG